MPELLIEFYEQNALLKIGKAIGPILRIDAHTANEVRGRFARLCVQVNLDKPLIQTIYLGKLTQAIQYESISMLYFAYGRIGHKKESCPYHIKEPHKEAENEQSSNSKTSDSL